jgi:hypothetical protein
MSAGHVKIHVKDELVERMLVSGLVLGSSPGFLLTSYVLLGKSLPFL